MPSTRILHKNLVKLASSVQCTTQASAYPASNLSLDQKSKVWRSNNTNLHKITVQWDVEQPVNTVALAFTNLSSSAQVRVQVYKEVGDTTPLYTIPFEYILSDRFSRLRFGISELGQYIYPEGASSIVSLYTPDTYLVKKVIVSIKDTSPDYPYFEVADLIVGEYYEFERGCDYNPSVSFVDSSDNTRSESGDLRSNKLYSYKKLSFDITSMTMADRDMLASILAKAGTTSPLLVSLMAEADDPSDEAMYQVYGKLSSSSAIQYKYLEMFDTSLEIEEI